MPAPLALGSHKVFVRRGAVESKRKRLAQPLRLHGQRLLPRLLLRAPAALLAPPPLTRRVQLLELRLEAIA